jgi:tetratricopeptide (TPR) repeat protein
MFVLISVALGLTAQVRAVAADAAVPTVQDPPAENQKSQESQQESQIEGLRRDTAGALARGDWSAARAFCERILVLSPHDAAAQRDAGRASMAAGDFSAAAQVLEQAHHAVGHHRDAELHYLRGEALYELGRVEEARSEHRIAELEIGAGPVERMQSLWLARIYARRGELNRADGVYESLWPPTSQPVDAEVGLNHAEAHFLVRQSACPPHAGLGLGGGWRSGW